MLESRAAAGHVVVYASGTDLESGNPLVTIHPLSRQIQRFALYVTLGEVRRQAAAGPVRGDVVGLVAPIAAI